jgi:MFS family permease
MFQWYKVLSGREKRTLFACFGGWGLDALDTTIYGFLIPTLIAAWGMTSAEAGILGTAALISSSLGGWLAGMLCDRIGRVKVLLIAICWFSFFTLLSGFTNSFDQLLVARVLSGIGFGGEWAAGSVLMGEVIRPESRGKAVGTVQSSYAVGYAIAALMSSVLFATLAPNVAWRAMFWIGVSPAIIVFILLRGVTEPDVFIASRKARQESTEEAVNPLAIFSRGILPITILTSLLALGVQGAGFVMTIWLPTFLKTVYHMSTVDVGYNMFVYTVGSFFGYIASAYLCDAIGRRKNFVIFVALCWISIPAFLYLPSGPILLRVLEFTLGFSTLGIYSALGPYFTELFPTAIRASGQGFSYNFGRGFGAFFPAVVGMLSGHWMSFQNSVGLMSLGAYLFVLLAIMLLPETKGKDLRHFSAVKS